MPTPALQIKSWGAGDLDVKPIPPRAARQMCEANHYLGTYPGHHTASCTGW